MTTARLGDLASASIRGAGSGRMLALAFVLGTMALVLAAIGIYGVMAHTVVERTSQIGIRMALGATPRSIRRMVLGRGLLLAGVGLGVGGVGAWIASRTLATVLVGVSAGWIAFAAGAFVTLVVAIAATLVPASRAAAVDPATAIGHA